VDEVPTTKCRNNAIDLLHPGKPIVTDKE
jgi:hypothetical protein